MSLSDLSNPKAAAQLIDQFRKRFSSKTCMAPHSDHNGSIVSAHTLSVESMLRRIAIDGHVYAAVGARNLASDQFPIEVARRGIRDVSVFNGFCQGHDRDLFSCLETEPFRFTRKQCFMLAYRAACRECYLKRRQFETVPSTEAFRAVHGREPPPGLAEAMLLMQAGSLSGANDAEALKVALDSFLLKEEWDRVVTHAVLFPRTPSILATAAFQPFFTMDGEQLQDFADLEGEVSNMCFSLIPLESGGAAIFSWLDTHSGVPKRYFESVLRQADLTTSVMHVALDNTENVAFAPVWYENLEPDEKAYLFSRILQFEAGPDYASRKKSGNSLRKLDDWGNGKAASF